MSSSDVEDIFDGTPEPDETPEPGADSEPAAAVPDDDAGAHGRAGPLRLKAAVILPLLFAVAGGAYYFMIDGVIADQLVAQGRSYAGEGGEAQVGEVNFSIFGPKLTVRNFEVWQNLPDRGVHEVLYLDEAVLDVDFWPLLERRVVVNELSATKIRLQQPIREDDEEAPDADVPTDTNNKDLNDYLEDVKEILESEEVDDLRELLDKLRDHMVKKEEKEDTDRAEEQIDGIGPAGRAWYVVEALKQKQARARVVVKKAGVNELAFTFGEEDAAKFAYKVTDLDLTAEHVSSDPIAHALPMRFNASGNLDGDKGRRVELGLTLRFDPDELVTLEQVDGAAAFASLPIGNMVDPGVFGDTLTDAKLSLTHYAPTHSGLAGRTKLAVSGLVQPPGFPGASRASFAIWFGGFDTSTQGAAMLPSGISVQVEDFPLAPVLNLAGGSPIPLKDHNATISFGTCDADGVMGGPGAALSWHDGLSVRLRLKVNGLEFADPEGELAGLPGTFLVRGLNRVVEDLGGLDVIVGFRGRAEDIALDLEKPGLRGFVDAVVNALVLTAPEIESMVDLPFSVSGDSEFGLASVNADGTRRDPALSLEGEARHDLKDLRVALSLRNVTATPKAGRPDVLGLPADDFCKAFNAFMGSLGDEGLTLRTRVMNAGGQFSPALESPGVRGFVDAMAGVLTYSGQQLNRNFNLPLALSPGADIRCESVGVDGQVRGLNSPGADSDDLSNLRIRVRAANFTVSPKPGERNILGIPADQFCKCFNTFIKAQGDKGVALDWGVLDAQGNFAPTLKQPGTRGLLDGVINTLNFTGAELNESFNLPFKLDDKARVTSASVNPDNSRRHIDGPGSNSHDLKDLRIQLILKDGYAAKKAGVNTIYGVPADYFTFAWNKMQGAFVQQGFPMQLKLFNDRGVFEPSVVKPDEQEMLKMMGTFVGINDFESNFRKLAERFVDEFPAFRKDGLKVAEDIAKGRFKLPGKDDSEDKPEMPDIPDIPDLPWGK